MSDSITIRAHGDVLILRHPDDVSGHGSGSNVPDRVGSLMLGRAGHDETGGLYAMLVGASERRDLAATDMITIRPQGDGLTLNRHKDATDGAGPRPEEAQSVMLEHAGRDQNGALYRILVEDDVEGHGYRRCC